MTTRCTKTNAGDRHPRQTQNTLCVLSDADSRLGMEVWNRKRGRIDTDSVGWHERAGRREGKRECVR